MLFLCATNSLFVVSNACHAQQQSQVQPQDDYAQQEENVDYVSMNDGDDARCVARWGCSGCKLAVRFVGMSGVDG